MAAMIARSVFYAGTFWFFLHVTSNANEMWRGIGGGIIMADLITWIGRSIDKAYKYPAEFLWDSVINVVIVIVLVWVFGIPFSTQGEGWSMGIMAFMITVGVKLIWYIAQDVSENG